VLEYFCQDVVIVDFQSAYDREDTLFYPDDCKIQYSYYRNDASNFCI